MESGCEGIFILKEGSSKECISNGGTSSTKLDEDPMGQDVLPSVIQMTY